MKQIVKDLNKLKEEDLITIILYAIYKFTEDPEYSTLAELAYTLDRHSFYNLCATFGGTTLKIPTLKEYKTMVKVMLIFEFINSDGLTFAEACTKANVDCNDEDIIKMYSLMTEVISSYEE